MLLPVPQSPAPPPQAGAVYRIPYRLSDTKHIIVRVKLNGKGPFSFILDTGSPAFIISQTVAVKAGIDHTPESWANVKTFDLEGGLTRADVRARIWDPFQLKHMNATGLADVDIAGVLGYSLIGRYRLDIDLKRRFMLWTDSGVEPQMPSLLEVTGGRPIRPSEGIGDLDAIAASARQYLPKKRKQVTRGRGFIGIEIEDDLGGVRVKRVAPGSPAAKAGMEPGDLIRNASVGGEAEAVEKADRLIEIASGLAPGRRLFLVVKRGERQNKLAITAERAAL